MNWSGPETLTNQQEYLQRFVKRIFEAMQWCVQQSRYLRHFERGLSNGIALAV